jgi:hypothetical protein
VLLASVENKNTGKSNRRTAVGAFEADAPAFVSERSLSTWSAATSLPLLDATEEVGGLATPLLILHHRKSDQKLE